MVVTTINACLRPVVPVDTQASQRRARSGHVTHAADGRRTEVDIFRNVENGIFRFSVLLVHVRL